MSFPISTNLKRLFGMLPSSVKVQNFRVGEGHPVFIIAEIGNNHNGDFELAKKTILAAKECGADAVKFQKRTVEEVFTKEMQEMPYVNERSLAPTYGEHRRKLEFNRDQFVELKKYAEDLGLVFFVTPFDKTSADFLESIGVHAYKISSFDVTNLPLLEHVAKKGKPILLSTGMSTLEEIDTAIETILKHNDRLIVNHCTSIYPTPDESIDLHMVTTLNKRYAPLPVGYSGHEPDILPTVASTAMNARTVERHFTLDKKMRGSDHHMSIDPKDFTEMVSQIRRMEKILGSQEKRIHALEKPIRKKHGKSIVTSTDIPEGTILTKDMLTFKSPGTGFTPGEIGTLIGRRIVSPIPKDTVLTKEHLAE